MGIKDLDLDTIKFEVTYGHNLEVFCGGIDITEDCTYLIKDKLFRDKVGKYKLNYWLDEYVNYHFTDDDRTGYLDPTYLFRFFKHTDFGVFKEYVVQHLIEIYLEDLKRRLGNIEYNIGYDN